jgi:hypothetical protein
MAKTKEEYKKLIGSGIDEANLSDQELKDRLDAYQQLGSMRGEVDAGNTLRDEIQRKLSSMDVPDVQTLGPIIHDIILRNGGYPDAEQLRNQLRDYAAKNPTLPVSKQIRDSLVSNTSLTNFINDQNVRNGLSNTINTMVNPENTAEDIKRIQGLINDRAGVATESAKVDEFLNTVPGQLDQERQSYYDSQRNRAKDYITGEYAPQVAEQLALTRGLGDSGQVGSSITSKYSNLLEGINQAELNQMNEDATFFSDQAYNKVFSDLVNAKQDVSSTISNERQNLRTNTQSNFAKNQSELEKEFNLDLFREQSKSAYKTMQDTLTSQKEAQKSAETADLIKTGVQTGIMALL